MRATFAKPPARRRPSGRLRAVSVRLLAAALVASGAGIPAATASPDRGDTAPAPGPAAAAAPCFGAAAWDREHPCHNSSLAYVVEPAPADAERAPNAPCTTLQEQGLVRVCSFGIPAQAAQGTVALVGDSHASHWRAALEDVAGVHGWHGISLARTSCPLSKATRNMPEPARSQCVQWNRQVLRWFWEHPEVDTVFTGELSGGKGVIAPKGRDPFEARVDGYLRAWRALPSSVRHIVVIRDTPKARRHGQMAACVSRALARRRAAGQACSVRRFPS